MTVLWPKEGQEEGGRCREWSLSHTWIVPTGEADEGAHAIHHRHSRSTHVHVIRLVASRHRHCAVIKRTACCFKTLVLISKREATSLFVHS